MATASTVALCADSAPTVSTVSTVRGELEGVRSGAVDVFRSIPFAAPPMGNLRWREPQPPPSWQGLRSASSFGNACIQKTGFSSEGGGGPGSLSEDSVYLNVWTPSVKSKQTGDAKLPVMVWRHGGALGFGAGSLKLYDGAALAKQGVVVVALNARLGPLGLFRAPSTRPCSALWACQVNCMST